TAESISWPVLPAGCWLGDLLPLGAPPPPPPPPPSQAVKVPATSRIAVRPAQRPPLVFCRFIMDLPLPYRMKLQQYETIGAGPAPETPQKRGGPGMCGRRITARADWPRRWPPAPLQA